MWEFSQRPSEAGIFFDESGGVTIAGSCFRNVTRRGGRTSTVRRPTFQTATRAHVPQFETYNGGAPDRSRTCDLRYRKPALYPLSYGGRSVQLHKLSALARVVRNRAGSVQRRSGTRPGLCAATSTAKTTASNNRCTVTTYQSERLRTKMMPCTSANGIVSTGPHSR